MESIAWKLVCEVCSHLQKGKLPLLTSILYPCVYKQPYHQATREYCGSC